MLRGHICYLFPSLFSDFDKLENLTSRIFEFTLLEFISLKQAENSYLLEYYHLYFRSSFDASVGTEELNHIEMVCTIVHQLTRNLTVQQIKEQGFADYYVDHTTGIYPVAASGTPWSADTMQSTGDPITDLMENMAAEQKARTTYDNILRLVKDDPDVYDAIKFLRAREIVHFQRFGESLRIVQDNLNSKNFYAFNPAFDNKKC